MILSLSRLALALGWLTVPALGEELVLEEARQALAESLPDIAIYKLRQVLADPELAPDEQTSATLLLGQAQAATGSSDEALATIQPLTAEENPGALFLRARVLTALGNWTEARTLFHKVAAQPQVDASAAMLGEAEALQALGRTEDAALLLEKCVAGGKAGMAVRVRWTVLLAELGRAREADDVLRTLEPSTPEERKWRMYAEAKLLLQQDQAAPALRLFEDILERRENLPEALHVAATFGATDARVALRGTQSADDVLENFIWRNPFSPYLESVFRRLDQIYAEEEQPSQSELQKWLQKPPAHRAALATFYLARMQVRQKRWEKAAGTAQYFLRTYPTQPLGAEAALLQAQAETEKGRLTEAVRALEDAMRRTKEPELRPAIELRTGLAQYQLGEFLLSATLFEDAARHADRLRGVAIFNAALAWLHVPNFDRFRSDYRTLIQEQPQSPLRGELLLEEGLVQARLKDARATDSLKAFLRDYPRSERRAEARLALAELGMSSEKDPESAAAQYLQVSDPLPPSPEIAAQADYLAIFLADAQQPPEEAKVIALAQQFLRVRPEAAQVPEVRMKLGQVFFRREDYANAETQMATLANANPGGPYTEAALFLAGESAMRLINPGAVDRALEYFDRVLKLEGPLKPYARQEQAIVQEKLEHEDQAIALYDIILSTEGVDAELWAAALCGKGNCLATLGRRELPGTGHLEQAVAVFSRLAGAPGVSAAWRNQALYKKGKALELLGRTGDSQEAFYDALSQPSAAGREYFWFYKAGFDAARVYEQQEKWKEAIGIYQKMVQANGPRTAEAQGRLRQVRLEHFIWD